MAVSQQKRSRYDKEHFLRSTHEYRIWFCHYSEVCGVFSGLTNFPRKKVAVILADDFFKCIFMNESFFCILISISPKSFFPVHPIDNKSEWVQVMAWCRTGDKPLPEPKLTQITDAYVQLKSAQCFNILPSRTCIRNGNNVCYGWSPFHLYSYDYFTICDIESTSVICNRYLVVFFLYI